MEGLPALAVDDFAKGFASVWFLSKKVVESVDNTNPQSIVNEIKKNVLNNCGQNQKISQKIVTENADEIMATMELSDRTKQQVKTDALGTAIGAHPGNLELIIKIQQEIRTKSFEYYKEMEEQAQKAFQKIKEYDNELSHKVMNLPVDASANAIRLAMMQMGKAYFTGDLDLSTLNLETLGLPMVEKGLEIMVKAIDGPPLPRGATSEIAYAPGLSYFTSWQVFLRASSSSTKNEYETKLDEIITTIMKKNNLFDVLESSETLDENTKKQITETFIKSFKETELQQQNTIEKIKTMYFSSFLMHADNIQKLEKENMILFQILDKVPVYVIFDKQKYKQRFSKIMTYVDDDKLKLKVFNKVMQWLTWTTETFTNYHLNLEKNIELYLKDETLPKHEWTPENLKSIRKLASCLMYFFYMEQLPELQGNSSLKEKMQKIVVALFYWNEIKYSSVQQTDGTNTVNIADQESDSIAQKLVLEGFRETAVQSGFHKCLSENETNCPFISLWGSIRIQMKAWLYLNTSYKIDLDKYTQGQSPDMMYMLLALVFFFSFGLGAYKFRRKKQNQLEWDSSTSAKFLSTEKYSCITTDNHFVFVSGKIDDNDTQLKREPIPIHYSPNVKYEKTTEEDLNDKLFFLQFEFTKSPDGDAERFAEYIENFLKAAKTIFMAPVQIVVELDESKNATVKFLNLMKANVNFYINEEYDDVEGEHLYHFTIQQNDSFLEFSTFKPLLESP